jgi:hypothetical protein
VLEKGVVIEYIKPKALLAQQSAFKILYDQYESRQVVAVEETK